MRNKLVLLLLSFMGVLNVNGQTALEKAMKRINVSINIPSAFSVTQNEELMFVTKDSIIPTLEQIYNFKPAYGSTALKVIFSMIHSIFTHQDGECVIFVYSPPGKGGSDYRSAGLYTLNNLSFGRIKHDVALADVIKGVSMFKSKSIDVPVLGIVENMSWFTPEELPDNKYYLFGKDGGKNMAQYMNIPFLGQIPIVMSIREGGDLGIPAAWDEKSITGKSFMELADRVIEQVNYRNENLKPTERVRVKKR